VIGNVVIRRNVFVAPGASIRNDTDHPIYIDSNANIQDCAAVTGLAGADIVNGNHRYAVYIGRGVSCASGCVVYGPCKIGNCVYVGARAVLSDASVGDGCFISPGAVITDGVRIGMNRFVPPGAVIDTQDKANRLSRVSSSQTEQAREMQKANQELAQAYCRSLSRTRSSSSSSSSSSCCCR
jgi:carbon dioxide concentrating mechanism protein CcmM